MESNTNHEGDRVDGEGEPTNAEHLDGVADGCGCAEVWEHLSEHRDED